MVQAQLEQVIHVAADHMAELATTAVSRLGWRIKFANSRLRQLSAFDNKTERYGHDAWHYEFDVTVKWKRLTVGTRVIVFVQESNMEWTQEQCHDRCRAILDAIAEDASELAAETDSHSPDSHGSARWATTEKLIESGYCLDGTNHKRFILGPQIGHLRRFISVPAPETAMHAAICGPTGSGKTSTIYVPNLIERVGISAIVTEATAGDELPDLYLKTSGFREKAGHSIYKFNPDDLTSCRINPLHGIRTYDHAAQTASLIMENTSSRFTHESQIWENSERQLLTALIIHAAGNGEDLGAIRRWLRQGPDGLGMILMNSPMEEAREEFWGFYSASSEGFRCGVVSGLMQRLNLWVNPRIVALTKTTDIDLGALADQLFTLYLAVPAHKTYLKPLAALIFNFVLNLALERRFKHPLALFLDEFTNFGYIPAIAEKLTIIRHRNIPATLGFQDYVQLRKVYGDEDATLLFGQPATKIFFRPREIATARKISEALGQKTVVDRKVSTPGHIQEREFGRPLMNAGEVMSLKKGHVIVFTPSTDPVLLRTFTWQDYKDAITCAPPTFRKLEVDEVLVRVCNQTRSKPDWQKRWESAPKSGGSAERYRRSGQHDRGPGKSPERTPGPDESDKTPDV